MTRPRAFGVADVSDPAILADRLNQLLVRPLADLIGQIEAGQIADNAIDSPDLIVDGTITATEIAANTITAAQIAANTITATEIAANAITASELNANAVTAGKISAGAIDSDTLIVDGTITAAKLDVTQLSAITADIGEITAGELHNGADDAGIVLSGSLPGTWTRYLNLLGSGTFLKHDKLQLDYDGSATFAGTMRSLVGGSTTTAPAVQLLYQTGGITTTNTADHSVGSYAVPANAMATDGDTLRITFVRTGSLAGDKTYITYGATTIYTETDILLSQVEILITRTGAATQRAVAIWPNSGGTVGVATSSPAETLSGAVTLDFRAQAAVGPGSITIYSITVEFLGA